MATIFTITNDNSLDDFRQIFEFGFDHKDHLFSLEHRRIWSRSDITGLKHKNEGFDVFSINKSYKTEPHWHYGAEERLILSGNGRFFIPTAERMYVIDVEPGDLIWLSPCLQHWFETDGIMAARFFSEDLAHIEHKENISEEVISWNATFKNGFAPKI